MKIAILGYGKMGKVIEKLALDRGHSISYRVNIENKDDLQKVDKSNTDVVIEFSNPESAFQNLEYCMKKGLKVVCGTTGWLDHKSEIESLCNNHLAAFFYSSNYSIGVNLFFKLNKYLAGLIAPYNEYEVNTSEIHHTQKLDSPSGTSITIAEGIIENIPAKTGWVNNQIAASNEVPIWSSREGKIPGTHTVRYISDIDEIEISHKANSRSGFGLGAVIAAEWLKDKMGVFGMDDLLGI